MGVENAISSSIITSGPSISSEFSFANTAPLSAPAEISLGGTFSSASFLDCSPIASVDLSPSPMSVPSVFETGLADINLDPDLPSYEIPQVFTDAFSSEELLDPPLFSEQINVLDIPTIASESPVIEQINYSTEAKLTELFGEPLTALKLEILDRKVEDLTGFEPTLVKIVLPKVNESIIQEIAAEVIDQNIEQVVSGPALQEAVKELAILTEMPAVLPEEPSYAKASAGEEKKKKKKKEFNLKFVVDLKALANIYQALKKAVALAPAKAEKGKDIIDSNDVGALMPTEVENPGIKSGILPAYILEWFNYGDGAYREAVVGIKNLGLRSRQSILEKGFAIHRNLPPVTFATIGQEVEKADVERVLAHKPDPIRHLRK